VFARLANGNAEPVRIIEGQDTKLSRSMHDIAYDDVHDEIVGVNPFAEAILFFRGGANGDEHPVRIIQGPHTQLDSPQHFGLDIKNNEVLVPTDPDRILVYRRDASGDAAPIRVLGGPKTKLVRPQRAAVDAENDLLIVASAEPPSLLIFDRTAQGDVAPRAVITGPKTGLMVTRSLKVYPPSKEIIVAVMDNPAHFREGRGQPGFVGVWNYSDNGDVAPKAVIRGPRSTLIRPRGIALNPTTKEMYVVDMYKNALLTFAFPELFERARK
jgi:hypothetical protein